PRQLFGLSKNQARRLKLAHRLALLLQAKQAAAPASNTLRYFQDIRLEYFPSTRRWKNIRARSLYS
ncbi:MAG TPA: hypothetical protein VGN52_03680, partial [Burkholderiales bacterium]